MGQKMFQKEDLSAIFGRFAGREVGLVQKPYEFAMKRSGMVIHGTKLALADEKDPTVTELREVAAKNGVELRILWPGVGSSDDVKPGRVNAIVQKAPDDKWRVTQFYIG
jgi:hypothetical protein